jgi:hypothetical protein
MNSPLATPHRWTSRDLRISHLRLLHPDSLVGTDGSGRDKTHKSNVALLLQPTLHNFNALAPVNLLDRITYGPNSEKSRKSNAALLLPHLFPVSPLLHYSYKKMGDVGVARLASRWFHSGWRGVCVPTVSIGRGHPKLPMFSIIYGKRQKCLKNTPMFSITYRPRSP